mmetsp:Transcript_91894/g.163598  ORF Transcript_91894/g.163598 Transcript_91894/m.163598 type:complete len:429 (-) Transcript_91894:138-1424(-)
MLKVCLAFVSLELSYAATIASSQPPLKRQLIRSQTLAIQSNGTASGSLLEEPQELSPEVKSQVFRSMFTLNPGSMLDSTQKVQETPQMLFAEMDKSFDQSLFSSQSCSASLILLKKFLAQNKTLAKRKNIVHIIAQLRDDAKYLNKYRLPLMSFLATQDKANTELWLWIDTHDKSYLQSNAWRESIEPVLLGRSNRVKTKVFDSDKLLEHVQLMEAERTDFRKIYTETGGAAKKTDLARILILMAYGGTYVDSDSVFLQDIRPTLTIDDSWAYDQKEGFVNNAYMSAPSPGTEFTSALFQAALAANGEGTYDFFQFGAKLLRTVWDMHRRPANKDHKKSLFHVLPSCFFEAGPKTETFFAKKATKDSLAYFQAKSPTAFFYHWHDHWNDNVVEGSVADCVEQSLMKQLDIPYDGPPRSPDLCTITEDV